MRKLMEIWGDEERSYVKVTEYTRQYRLFGGYQDDKEEEVFTIGSTTDAIKFMLKFFSGLHLKIGKTKVKEDAFSPVIEAHLELKER
jgi:hypothetical protein